MHYALYLWTTGEVGALSAAEVGAGDSHHVPLPPLHPPTPHPPRENFKIAGITGHHVLSVGEFGRDHLHALFNLAHDFRVAIRKVNL